MRPRKSRDRRKPDAPILYTHTPPPHDITRARTEQTVGAKSDAILDRCQYAYLNTDRSMGAYFDGHWGFW